MTIDWQNIALISIGALCSIIWWEVRSLRRSKHENAQILQWCVFAIGILAKHSDIDLPAFKDFDK